MATIGTAGHVDHGKSTLVRALTGIDPDRLAEEQARGMTIDLGFAWLTLPDGRAVSIVDVPGHEDFIKNMLAGVGGIDLALLVVAADEGVMPQTREHLAILSLLRIPRAVVALTKADLVDAEWLDLARDDVQATLAETPFAAAPIVPVSAATGAGLADLVATLAAALPLDDARPADGAPRLPVDRVFTIAGFGTVVTGTLLDGPLAVGQEVEALPQGLRGRVRGMQTHNAAVSQARPGARVALNLGGINHQQIARGTVIARPGALAAATLLDVRLEAWSGAPRQIVHNMPVECFVGAAVVPARVRLLEADALAPGAAGWAQIELGRPVAARRGDRCVLRNASPSETLGGGQIVDPAPRRHRRRRPEVLAQLAALATGDPAAILRVALADGRPRPVGELAARARLTPAVSGPALAALAESGPAVEVGEFWLAAEAWAALRTTSATALAAFHRRFPLRAGMPREEWRARLRLDPRPAEAVAARLAALGEIAPAGATALRRPDHEPTFSAEQQAALATALARLRGDPLNPPPRADLEALAGAEVLAAAADAGLLTRLGDDLFLPPEAFAAARDAILAHLRQRGSITVAEARDLVGGTRRVVVPLLAALDDARLTRRVGDVRVLGLASAP